jgi:hypothetical protein
MRFIMHGGGREGGGRGVENSEPYIRQGKWDETSSTLNLSTYVELLLFINKQKRAVIFNYFANHFVPY